MKKYSIFVQLSFNLRWSLDLATFATARNLPRIYSDIIIREGIVAASIYDDKEICGVLES